LIIPELFAGHDKPADFLKLQTYTHSVNNMDECSSFREIDMIEKQIDPERVRKLAETWGITVTADGKVRIPVCSYSDVLPLIKKRPER